MTTLELGVLIRSRPDKWQRLGWSRLEKGKWPTSLVSSFSSEAFLPRPGVQL